MMQRGSHVRRPEKCLFRQNRACYQVCDPECAPLLGKQTLYLLDTTIMQSFLCFLSSHFHSLMNTAFLPSFSNWSLKVTLLTGGWRSILQALIVWWIQQLQNQSKITPPGASLLPWIPRFMSAQAIDNDLWLPRRPQPSPSQPPRLTDRDFLLRWEPSRHSPAIKGLPSVTEADLQQELIHTVSHVCSPSLPPPYTYK